jgi:hypothetical protein
MSTTHEFHIVVNGKQKTVTTDQTKELSYEDVVRLDYPNAVFNDNQTVYTVTYKRGEGNKPEGELAQGDRLKLKEGMIINVTPTDRS